MLCKDLETQARAGELERCRALEAQLDELFDQTWDALADEFAGELGQQGVHVEPPPA